MTLRTPIPGLVCHETWVQDPDTGRLILKSQYMRRLKYARERAELMSDLPSPQLMRDIEPFRNVAVDGKEIGSRSAKREMMKRHGLVEMGNEKRVTKRIAKPRTPIAQSIKRSIQELSSR